jgi:hypothetical protein
MSHDVIIRVSLINVLLVLSSVLAKNFEYRLIQSNNIQRQELFQQKCDKYYADNDVNGNRSVHTLSEMDMEHLLIDRNHKFLYCYVPKVSYPSISCAINLNSTRTMMVIAGSHVIFSLLFDASMCAAGVPFD